MGLVKQPPMTIPLIGGLDTKGDPKALPPGASVTADNLVFDETGSIAKRQGFIEMGSTTTAGGSITTARGRALGVRGDELLWFAAGKVYTRIEKENAWADRGRFESVLVTQKTPIHDRTDQVNCDRAETGNVAVYAWYDEVAAGVRYACIDKVTGAIMDSSSTPFVSGANLPKCRAINGKLHVYYRNSTNLLVDVIDPTDVYGTLGASPITLATDCFALTTAAPVGQDSYDVELMGTNVLIAYVYSNAAVAQYKVGVYDSAGVVVTAFAAKARSAAGGIAVSYNASASSPIAVARITIAAVTGRLDWLKSTLADETTVDVSLGTIGTATHIAVVVLTNNTAYAFHDSTTSGILGTRLITRVVVTAAGVTTSKAFVRHSKLGSRPVRWSDGGTERILVHVAYSGSGLRTAAGTDPESVSSCYVLMDGAYVIGDTEGGAPAAGEEVGLLARLLPGKGGGNGGHAKCHLPQIESLGSNQFACALLSRRRRATGTPTARVFLERGLVNMLYTFADSRAYQGYEEGGALYLPGGYVAEYDGNRVVESGFWTIPEEMLISEAGTGGGLTDGTTYYYRLYWEWRNGAGERVLSSYIGNVSKLTGTTGGNDNTISFQVRTAPYTNKSHVVLAVYRSALTAVAGPFYRISTLDPDNWLENDVNANSITFTDTGLNGGTAGNMGETTLLEQELDPLSEGELDSSPPPPTSFIAIGQARGFTRDPEDTSLIWYAKQRPDGVALEWNEARSLRVPQKGGEVTGVEVGDNAVILFKEDATYLTTGEGPSNTDLQSNYPAPQLISPIGCTESRSIVRCPLGVFRRSRKGIYLLTNGYEDIYVGAPIEEYLTSSVTITGAVHIPDKHQVRFSTSDTTSPMFVYDYLVREWSRWTSSQINAASAVIWQDTHVYLNASQGGAVPFEPQATWYDGDAGVGPVQYALKYTSRWIPLGSIIGRGRLWVVGLLGEWRSVHNIIIEISYDYEDAIVDTFTWSPVYDTGGAILTVGKPIRFRFCPSRQQATAIQITVRDANQGATQSREALKLTSLEFEYGVEPGAARRAAATTK